MCRCIGSHYDTRGRGRWERGEDSCEMRRFAERMRQGVGFGRQVVPVGRLWGRIPTGSQNRAVGLIAADYSSNRGPVVTIMHSPGYSRRFNTRVYRAFNASAKSYLFRENLNIRWLDEVHRITILKINFRFIVIFFSLSLLYVYTSICYCFSILFHMQINSRIYFAISFIYLYRINLSLLKKSSSSLDLISLRVNLLALTDNLGRLQPA